jgi:hypothetical protein
LIFNPSLTPSNQLSLLPNSGISVGPMMGPFLNPNYQNMVQGPIYQPPATIQNPTTPVANTPAAGGNNASGPVAVASGVKPITAAATAATNTVTPTPNTGGAGGTTTAAQTAAARANQNVASNVNQFTMPSMQGITFGGS